jgi:F0F1-type ATP synthase assembly protein I
LNFLPRLKPAPGTERIGDGAQAGIEVVGTIVVAFLVGWGLDSWLGTTPLFMAGLTVLAAVAKGIVLMATYSQRMQVLEADRRTTVARTDGSEAAEA